MLFPLADQMRLLDLQAVDVELAQVRHRQATAPLAARARQLEQQTAQVHRQVVEAQTQGQDLERLVARSEQELERVRARLTRDREMADQGAGVKLQRELEHELGSLTRRISELEDAELELMEQQEQLAQTVTELQGKEAELTQTLGASRDERDAAAAELTSRERELRRSRAEIAASLPDQLVATYERARSDSGTGVALLAGSQCQGCRLQLPPSEVDRLRSLPPEQIEHCEECGCIIVREA